MGKRKKLYSTFKDKRILGVKIYTPDEVFKTPSKIKSLIVRTGEEVVRFINTRSNSKSVIIKDNTLIISENTEGKETLSIPIMRKLVKRQRFKQDEMLESDVDKRERAKSLC